MKNPESQPQKESTEARADKLNALQAEKNDGRGVSCVREIVMYLRKGDIGNAKKVCWGDGDKIRNYPDVLNFLKTELFGEDNQEDIPPHFRTASDELYND